MKTLREKQLQRLNEVLADVRGMTLEGFVSALESRGLFDIQLSYGPLVSALGFGWSFAIRGLGSEIKMRGEGRTWRSAAKRALTQALKEF